LASSQVGLPENILWTFGFFGLFTLKKFPLKKNITIAYFAEAHLQNVCNRPFIRLTPASDLILVKFERCKVQNTFFA